MAQVFEKGAAAVLVEDAPAEAKGPYIQVASCYQALKDIAEFYRKTLTIPVVGIVAVSYTHLDVYKRQPQHRC